MPAAVPAPPVRKRPRVGFIVAIALLSLALAGAVAAVVFYFIKLDEANAHIEEQNRQLEEQEQLIEQKEIFGAAMTDLMDTAAKFDGVLLDSVVPFDRYKLIAAQGWVHRWSMESLQRDVVKVRDASEELRAVLTTANTEATTSTTGSTYEAVIDQLSAGFATSVIDDADTLCASDVLACVLSDDPYTVHFDVADSTLPYMTDELRTGIAYHEFAHVLQLTNPEPTEVALVAFGGDDEIMADCFALTYLPGWKLDHRIWVSSYQYWDVSIGYGHTCDETQRQAVRDWYGQLGFHAEPISQDR